MSAPVLCLACRKQRVKGPPGPGDCLCFAPVVRSPQDIVDRLVEHVEREAERDATKRPPPKRGA